VSYLINLQTLRLSALLGLLLLAGCRCDPGPTESPAPTSANDRGTRPSLRAPSPADTTGASTDTAHRRTSIDFSYSPKVIRVFHETKLRFVAQGLPGRQLNFRWSVNGRKTGETGREFSYIARGARDIEVTLTAWDGDGFKQVRTRKVRLERLKVVPMTELDSTLKILTALPKAPAPKKGNFRFVIVSDSNASYGSVDQGEGVRAAITQIVNKIKPAFVIHNGDMIAGQKRGISVDRLREMWKGYHDAVTYPLRQASIPVIPVPGNHDADPGLPDRVEYVREWQKSSHRPEINFMSKQHYPLYYSFTHEGNYFVVIDSMEKKPRRMIRWLQRELRRARVYKSRYIFSHLPFEKLLATNYGTLQNKFVLYEMFIKYDVTTFFSAHYEVYYKGKYGDLDIVSTGILAGTCRKLIGQEGCQGMIFVVVDVVDRKPERIFAVRGPGFTQVYEDFLLPDQVGSYSRSY